MKTVRARHRMQNVVEPATINAPTVQLEHVSSGSAQLVAELPISPPDGQNAFRQGDVLFSKLRPYLAKSLLVLKPLQGTGEFLCLRPSVELDSRFLKYVTLSHPWLDHAAQSSYGSKMPRTSWEHMADFEMMDVPLLEQRRIADFLDDRVARIDQIIAARHRQAVLAESAITSAYYERTATLPRVPMRYLAREILVGIVVQPARMYSEAMDAIPTLRGLNVSERGIDTSALVRITPEGHAANPRSHLRSGDIVIVRTGDAGAATVIPPEMAGWNCIDLVIARPNTHVQSHYLALALNGERRTSAIAAASSGSIQQHFGVGALGGLALPFEEGHQTELARRLAADRDYAWAAVDGIRRNIALLQEYKQSLITAAVTGEFDVTTASTKIPE